MTSFRIHYQDNDGRGSEGQISVSLVRRSFAGQGSERLVLCEWDSNVQGPNSSLLTSFVKSCPYDISFGGFHHFEIVMKTFNCTASEVRFNGIDFP
jgi:hypothetical protein